MVFLDSSDNSTLISNSEEYLPAHIITTGTYNQATGVITLSGTYTDSGDNPDLFGNINNGDLITVNDENGGYIAENSIYSICKIKSSLSNSSSKSYSN